MKVAHLTNVHRRFDTRIFLKECVSAAQNKFDTFLIVADGLGDEESEGVKIIDVGKQPSNRLKRFVTTSRKIYKKALEIDCDIYHFHDPELLFVGYLLKRKGKIVIYDIHENVSEQILCKKYIPGKITRLIFSKLYRSIETFFGRKLDAFVTVTEGVARHLNHKNIHVVRNVPILSIIDSIYPQKSKNKDFTIIYPGSITRNRGIFDLIEALYYLKNKAVLHLYGNWYSEAFKEECENHPGWKYVSYMGVVSPKEVFIQIKKSDLGVHLVHDITNFEDSLPVKVYEFMACNIPCIVSDTKTHRELLGDYVYYATPKNARDIAAKIEDIINNESERHNTIVSARKFVENDNSWEKEKNKLISLYEDLIYK